MSLTQMPDPSGSSRPTSAGTAATTTAGMTPATTSATPAAAGTPLLQVRGLKVWFPITGGVLRRRTGWVYAVDGVDLDIQRGETLGLVGESGSGKTTTGRAIVRINDPTAGSISLDGTDLLALNGTDLRRKRRAVRRAAQAKDASGFAAAAVSALRVACAPHYPAEPRALVGSDVLALVRETGGNGRAGDVVRRFFAVTDASRFATAGGDAAELLALEPELERVLQQLEERL